MEEHGNDADRMLRRLLPERAMLSAYLYSRLEDWEEVGRALRETARIAGRRGRDAPAGTGFGPWVRGCAREALRRRGADATGGLLEGLDAPDLETAWNRSGGVTPEREAELDSRLRTLSALSQRLVRLHYREGIPCGRIAARYKERVETVHRDLIRLRRRLFSGSDGGATVEAGDAKERDRGELAVERYIEGSLFPSERASLRKRLAADPALRVRLVESVAQEAALRWVHRLEREDPLRSVTDEPGPRAWWGVAAGVLAAVGAVAWLSGEGPARPAPFRDAPGVPLNASFEEDDGGGRPAFWTNDRIRRDTAIFHDGTASLRVDGPDGADVSSTPVLSLEPGAMVRVSAWVRTRGVEPAPGRGVRLRLVRPGSDDRVLGATSWVGGTRDWQRVSFEAAVPGDCREGRLEIGWSLGGGGTVWVDGVSVERL